MNIGVCIEPEPPKVKVPLILSGMVGFPLYRDGCYIGRSWAILQGLQKNMVNLLLRGRPEIKSLCSMYIYIDICICVQDHHSTKGLGSVLFYSCRLTKWYYSIDMPAVAFCYPFQLETTGSNRASKNVGNVLP